MRIFKVPAHEVDCPNNIECASLEHPDRFVGASEEALLVMKRFVKAALMAAVLGTVSGCVDQGQVGLYQRVALVPLDGPGNEAFLAQLARIHPTLAAVAGGTYRFPLIGGRIVCPRSMVCPAINAETGTWTVRGVEFPLPATVDLGSRYLTMTDMREMYRTYIGRFGDYNPILPAAPSPSPSGSGGDGDGGGGGGGDDDDA